MKRKWILLLTAATLALSACACGAWSGGLEESAYDAADQNPDVTMTLEDETYARGTETISAHLENNSDAELSFGLDPHLDVELDGVWYTVPVLKEVAWIEIAYVLGAHGGTDYDFSLKDFYGRLPAGHYRIVRPLWGEAEESFALAEFTIE